MNRIDAEVLARADEDDPRSLLRDAEPLSVQKPGLDAVAARLHGAQRLDEEPLRHALDQTAYVLGDEGARLHRFEKADVVLEQVVGPLPRVGVRLLLAPVLLALPRRRERSARR